MTVYLNKDDCFILIHNETGPDSSASTRVYVDRRGDLVVEVRGSVYSKTGKKEGEVRSILQSTKVVRVHKGQITEKPMGIQEF